MFLPQCETMLRLRYTFTKYVPPPQVYPGSRNITRHVNLVVVVVVAAAVVIVATIRSPVLDTVDIWSLLGSYLQVFRFCRFL